MWMSVVNAYLFVHYCLKIGNLMATYSIFAFGTGERQTMGRKNIISQFSEACTTQKTILDGPGTLGREVAKNSRKGASDVLDWLMTQPTTDNNLNLSGFSRGSVTCIRIANILDRYTKHLETHKEKLNEKQQFLLERLKGLKLHIYAIDPVAGMSDKSNKDARVIPANVKSYVAVVQMDEMRRDFRPQDMTRVIVASPDTKVTMLPLYGSHSDTTKIKNENMQSGATLNWHSMYSFLTQHGTTFAKNKIPQIVSSKMDFSKLQHAKPKELLKIFAQHHQERREYAISGRGWRIADGMPIPRTERSLNKHLEYYVKDSNFFVNQMERELFKITYPKVFNYLFENNMFDPSFPKDSVSSKKEVRTQLELIRVENAGLFERLGKRGVSVTKETTDGEPVEKIVIGGPKGGTMLEHCFTLQQIFPDEVPSLVKEFANINKPVIQLEQEVYRMTFRYEREKSNFSPFYDRSEATRVQQIREDVNKIIAGENDPSVKAIKVMDCLEKHLFELVKADRDTDLIPMLKHTLKNHGRDYDVKYTSIPQEFLAEFTKLTLNLLKETIRFVTSGAYIVGGTLAVVGELLESFGSRIHDALWGMDNILKYPLAAIGTLFQGIGIAIKNSFGLKPLTELIVSGIKNIRDAIITDINPVNIERRELGQNTTVDAMDTIQQSNTFKTSLRKTVDPTSTSKPKAEEHEEPLPKSPKPDSTEPDSIDEESTEEQVTSYKSFGF
jgi:hypothetical protein